MSADAEIVREWLLWEIGYEASALAAFARLEACEAQRDALYEALQRYDWDPLARAALAESAPPKEQA